MVTVFITRKGEKHTVDHRVFKYEGDIDTECLYEVNVFKYVKKLMRVPETDRFIMSILKNYKKFMKLSTKANKSDVEAARNAMDYDNFLASFIHEYKSVKSAKKYE